MQATIAHSPRERTHDHPPAYATKKKHSPTHVYCAWRLKIGESSLLFRPTARDERSLIPSRSFPASSIDLRLTCTPIRSHRAMHDAHGESYVRKTANRFTSIRTPHTRIANNAMRTTDLFSADTVVLHVPVGINPRAASATRALLRLTPCY